MVHELKHRIGFKHSRGHLVLAHTGSQRPRDLATQQDHRQARECITACRFIPALTHYGLASRQAVEKIATARPPVTGTERGVSNREGDTRYLGLTTLCRNRFLLHCHRPPRLRLGYGLQWAATPKLTMIAGAGNFPSGSSRCESFLYNSTIADEIAEFGG